jgi:hypothetical protein
MGRKEQRARSTKKSENVTTFNAEQLSLPHPTIKLQKGGGGAT